METPLAKQELTVEHVQLKESQITKMCRTDRGVIFFWIAFLWVILVSVYYAISGMTSGLEGGATANIIALVALVLVGAFTTVALIAVSTHLHNKQKTLYSEDILHSELMKAQGQGWSFMKVFDVLFILILCYVSLLLPILMQGKVLVGGSGEGGLVYSVNPLTILLCVSLFAIYGFFLLKNSEKELKVLINNVYGRKEEQ